MQNLHCKYIFAEDESKRIGESVYFNLIIPFQLFLKIKQLLYTRNFNTSIQHQFLLLQNNFCEFNNTPKNSKVYFQLVSPIQLRSI